MSEFIDSVIAFFTNLSGILTSVIIPGIVSWLVSRNVASGKLKRSEDLKEMGEITSLIYDITSAAAGYWAESGKDINHEMQIKIKIKYLKNIMLHFKDALQCNMTQSDSMFNKFDDFDTSITGGDFECVDRVSDKRTIEAIEKASGELVSCIRKKFDKCHRKKFLQPRKR